MNDALQADDQLQKKQLDQMLWRQWFLLGSIPVLTTVVLAIILPIARNESPELWPWHGTDLILISGLYIMVVLFGWYTTKQQRRILDLRDRLVATRYEAREQRENHRNRLMAIMALSQALGDENDPRMVFDTLTKLCKDIFASDRASLMVVDDRTNELEVRAAIGHSNADEVLGTRRPVGEGVSGWVAQHREPLLLGSKFDPSKFPGEVQVSAKLRSAMIVPLIVREDVAGVLSVSNDVSDIEYDKDDLTTMKVFAETAEYCLRHAENADWMRTMIQQLRDFKQSGAEPPSFRPEESTKVIQPV